MEQLKKKGKCHIQNLFGFYLLKKINVIQHQSNIGNILEFLVFISHGFLIKCFIIQDAFLVIIQFIPSFVRFRCMDLDGDGYLSMYELEYFYEEQLQRMEQLGIETLPFEDCLCQVNSSYYVLRQK